MRVTEPQKIVPLKKQTSSVAARKKIRQKDIAEMVGMSIPWVSQRTNRIDNPIPSVKIDGSLTYYFDEVVEWIERNTEKTVMA